jgi:GNAT superfamily N-acetyltransferase
MDMYAPICFIEKDHWDEALQLVKKVFMEFEAPDYGEEGVADFMHAMGDESYLDMHRFYGAYEDDKLVGVIATRKDHHHIGLLFVDKDHQRKGIGRQLILHILDLKDGQPITVNASPYGHEFYKKLGFVDTAEEQITNGVRYYPMERS